MIRHKKPGQCALSHVHTHTHAHTHTESLFPLFTEHKEKVPPFSLPTPFPSKLRAPPLPPFQTPALIREAAQAGKSWSN